jgi:hypothetical protein
MKRLGLLLFVAGCGSSAVHNVPRQSIVVTAGALEEIGRGEMHVDSGGMRAEILGASNDDVELDFVYRGPSQVSAPLANGVVRRQIGLKLRAQDACNVVSVMWHLEPAPGIVVSVKRNEGQREHAECGVRGYANITAESSDAPPFVDRGEHHRLRARIDGETLRVYADGAPVWEGKLPAAAFAIDGPAGVRSDNGAFDFALRLGGANRAARVTYTLPDR